MPKVVYMDNAATTMIDPVVLEEMLPYLKERYGNPSSIHSLGLEAKEAIEQSRDKISVSIKSRADEIIFTSGGTEGNNLALKGVAFANRNKGKHIITTKIEHKCILNSCAWLQSEGFRVTYLDVDKEGFVNVEQLSQSIKKDTILVSIIHGHNEIGTIQNLTEVGKICKEYDVPLHTDACQSYTKTELDVKKQNIALATLNAHKIHGPKGVGAIYIREDVNFVPWQHGGGQERNRRGGTENTAGIVGFAKAVEIASNRRHIDKMYALRDRLIKGILEIEDTVLNGPRGEKRLCNNANFSFFGVEGEGLGMMLEQYGIKTSTGSACSSRSLEKSHVLRALGLDDALINSSIRMSISRFTTEDEIDYVIEKTQQSVKKLRKISPIKKVLDYVFRKGA
ncbi:MAG: cysteine desulfurase family protein [Candidatus Bilamarchaeaceae archaeon]